MLNTGHGGTVAEKPVELTNPDAIAETPQSPEALIEEARQHQRRRRMWFAMVVALLIAAGVIGFLDSGGSGGGGSRPGSSPSERGRGPGGSTAAKTSVKPVVDLAATPQGWVPVDYGNAQVSVPANWNISFDGGCPSPADGKVLLGQTGDWAHCSPEASQGDSVYIATTSQTRGTGTPIVVNGITAYRYEGGEKFTDVASSVWLVPSLGVELILTGPLSTKILQTLTDSPRSVALASGSAPSVPSSWHRVGFGPLSIAFPATFHETRLNAWVNPCNVPPNVTMTAPPTVVLDTGAAEEPSACSFTSTRIDTPNDGIFIDPGIYGPFEQGSTFGRCLDINGLIACPTTTDIYGMLVLDIGIPGNDPVAVEIGLAGSGEVARTILYSIEKW